MTLLNSPGTIDADYRGEVKVLLVNLGYEPFTVRRGERIAQLVIARVEHVRVEAVSELGGTTRGQGGFGSTGRPPLRSCYHSAGAIQQPPTSVDTLTNGYWMPPSRPKMAVPE